MIYLTAIGLTPGGSMTVAFTNLLTFNGDFSFERNQKLQGAKSGLYGCWQTWVMWCFAKKSLHKSCRMGRCTDADLLICSLGHRECNGHTVQKLSQQCLTADWLAPQDSDCLRTSTKVSPDWLTSYIKAIRPFLEIFKIGQILSGQTPHLSFWVINSFKNNVHAQPIIYVSSIYVTRQGPDTS
jgi:hypothetical protein